METDDYHRNGKRKQTVYRNPKTSYRTARVLSSELKDLELNGFIIKKVENGYPVSIEYELLPYSQTLEELVNAMTKWGIQHREKVKAEMGSEKSKKQ